MKKSLFALFLGLSVLQLSAQKLEVGLKNGDVLNPTSIKHKTPAFGSSHLLLDGEMKYPVNQVKYYQDGTGYYIWDYIGLGGNVKLKRELQGKINTFSRVVSSYSPGVYGPNGYGGGTFSSSKITYLQSGPGSIRVLNYDNLLGIVKDHKPSMNELAGVKNIKTWNGVAYGLGSALIVGGLAHMGKLNQQDGPPPFEDTTIKFSPLFFMGAAMFVIPLANREAKGRRLDNAVKLFNQ